MHREFKATDEIRENFAARWVQDGDCWRWVGPIGSNGYGRYRGTTAHRYAHLIHVGPIPDGFHVDHLCRNRWCVNPAHLEAVTPRTNTLRSRSNHCKQGHEFTPDNTMLRTMPDGHTTRRCRECVRCQNKLSG